MLTNNKFVQHFFSTQEWRAPWFRWGYPPVFFKLTFYVSFSGAEIIQIFKPTTEGTGTQIFKLSTLITDLSATFPCLEEFCVFPVSRHRYFVVYRPGWRTLASHVHRDSLARRKRSPDDDKSLSTLPKVHSDLGRQKGHVLSSARLITINLSRATGISGIHGIHWADWACRPPSTRTGRMAVVRQANSLKLLLPCSTTTNWKLIVPQVDNMAKWLQIST